MKVFFLHISKTAGQSVHAALVRAFGRKAVCPARANWQLRKLDASEVDNYQVFSGHLDWKEFDRIQGPRYVFTVLREPKDRILSLYFYNRVKALKMSGEQLAKKENHGLRDILELSPRDYFCGSPANQRRYIDNYDNFYTHYFATRSNHWRNQLPGLFNGKVFSDDAIMAMAQDNMALLDDVFTVNNMSRVFEKIREISGGKILSEEKYRMNVNKTVAAQNRMGELKALGADAETFDRIQKFCEMDNKLWEHYSKKDVDLAACQSKEHVAQ